MCENKNEIKTESKGDKPLLTFAQWKAEESNGDMLVDIHETCHPLERDVTIMELYLKYYRDYDCVIFPAYAPMALIDTVLQGKSSGTVIIANVLMHLFTQDEKYAINLLEFGKLDSENLSHIMALIDDSTRKDFNKIINDGYREKMRQVIEVYDV